LRNFSLCLEKMDSLTQIVLGAAVGEAVAGRKMGAKAALWGAVAGTVPDLDVFFRLIYDPMDAALAHRGFMHSLLFALLAAPAFGWIFFRLYKRKYTLKSWTWLWGLGIVTHPILDIFTNYGTQFLWPLDYRITFNTVFVIDPIYTLPFIVFLLVALFTKKEKPIRSKWNWAGIIWSTGYLFWGVIVKLAILSNAPSYFEKHDIKTTNAMVTPMPLTSFYWLIVSEDKEHYYVGYKSLFADFKKKDIQVIPKNHKILQRLKWPGKDRTKQLEYITNGYYSVVQSHDTVICYDLRFGTLKQLTDGTFEQPLMGYGMIVDNGVVQKSFALMPRNAVKAVTFGKYIDKVFGK